VPAYGIMFHHFHGDSHAPVQGSIPAEDLAAMIEFVGREHVLPAHEWQARALAGRLRADHLCLTFDDNLLCQFEVARPVLNDLDITAFWFVQTSVLQGNLERLEIYRTFRTRCYTDVDDFYDAFYSQLDVNELERSLHDFDPATYLAAFPFYSDADRKFRHVRDEMLGPDRYQETMDSLIESTGHTLHELARGLWMDATHLRALRDEGHILGLHSHTHPTRLAELPRAEQRREYAENHASLSRELGIAPTAVSHPCNSYDRSTLDILRELGIRLGFRANLAQTEYGPLEHPRADHANLIERMHACTSRSSQATSPATPR